MADIQSRLDKLSETTAPKWGIMRVNQMLRHLVEGAKITTGELKMPNKSNLFSRTLLRFFMLRAMIPSESMRKKNPPETFSEINVFKSNIPADDFATEKESLKATLNKILTMKQFPERHPLIGKMSKENWGQQTYSHLHYHFTQFGV